MSEKREKSNVVKVDFTNRKERIPKAKFNVSTDILELYSNVEVEDAEEERRLFREIAEIEIQFFDAYIGDDSIFRLMAEDLKGLEINGISERIIYRSGTFIHVESPDFVILEFADSFLDGYALVDGELYVDDEIFGFLDFLRQGRKVLGLTLIYQDGGKRLLVMDEYRTKETEFDEEKGILAFY